MSDTQREKWIDLVKCIAILIVMINHTVLDIPGVKFWGGMFFVPVFFVLSGFTHRSREESFSVFLGRKANRLLLPYITANGVLFVFFIGKNVLLAGESLSESFSEMFWNIAGTFYARNQLIAEGAYTLFYPSGIKNMFFYRMLNSPTWFLPALFLTVVLFEALLRFAKGNRRKIWLVAVTLLCFANLYHYLTPVLLPWSMDAIPYFLMMFLWGYEMKQMSFLDYVDRKKWIVVFAFVVFVASAKLNGSANYSIAYYGRSTTLALYNAMVSSTILMYLAKKIGTHAPKILRFIGQQTLLIMCYHLFLYSVIETICPEIYPAFTIVAALGLLTVVAWGKERLIYAKRQRH